MKNLNHPLRKRFLNFLILMILLVAFSFLSCKQKQNAENEALITNSTGIIYNLYFDNFTIHLYIDNKDIESYKQHLLTEFRSIGLIFFNYSSKDPKCDGTYYYEFRQGVHYFCKNTRCKNLMNPIFDFESLIRDLIHYTLLKDNMKSNVSELKLIKDENFQKILETYFSKQNSHLKKVSLENFDFDNYVKVIYSNDYCFDPALQYLSNLIKKE